MLTKKKAFIYTWLSCSQIKINNSGGLLACSFSPYVQFTLNNNKKVERLTLNDLTSNPLLM